MLTCRVLALQTSFPLDAFGCPVSEARPSYAPLACTASIISCKHEDHMSADTVRTLQDVCSRALT